MMASDLQMNSEQLKSKPPARCRSPFNSIKFFVLCHGMLQLAQLLVSGYLKSSISTIERRYGFSSQKSGILASFNEVGNTVLIVFVSFFGSRVHRPRFIGGGALVASLAALMMALPHFISGPYEYTVHISQSKDDNSGLCQLESSFQTPLSNHSCTQQESHAQQGVFPLLLLGQLLLGIGGVPIQPFGISYIDDYASKRNSPFYLGILLAVTSIGPAFGFMMGSFMLRFYVDIDKMSKDEIGLERGDPRWVGAWWLGFVVAASFLFLTSLPYLFFPKQMPKEEAAGDAKKPRAEEKKKPLPDPVQELTLTQFLKSFPRITLRTLQNPIYLLVVLAQVHLAAMIAGLATFMAKFIERQFTQTASFSNMMIGGVNIPLAVLGIVLGGALMRRLNISTRGSALICTSAILMCILTALPLLLLGCSTQRVTGIYPTKQNRSLECSSGCSCPTEDFNPVCGSDGVEFRSPCHAGCLTKVLDDNTSKILKYTDCGCIGVSGSYGYALPGTCGSDCKHLLLPFMVLSALTCFIASFSQTPSYMMILRTVRPEDKSFAVGVQYMLFRVLAFLPAPVLYGTAIDTTCIIWGKKCGRNTSCHYYNMDLFRQRFLGLQAFFVTGAFVCFLLSLLVLRHRAGKQGQQAGQGYTMIDREQSPDKNTASNELQSMAA
ncbi:solute carrier organic anion transporter family member 2B1-like [Salvelinus alpinus]|uniref:solute carrier organic anion transporter family member 2B1-like n=1 Tax=Salvelinus alpinus TaxID=8036 RepID=UPI000CDF9E38|nr:solute carrier organic anion transporter family member 2B1 isoform X1 [Salvelinus alpinus]